MNDLTKEQLEVMAKYPAAASDIFVRRLGELARQILAAEARVKELEAQVAEMQAALEPRLLSPEEQRVAHLFLGTP